MSVDAISFAFGLAAGFALFGVLLGGVEHLLANPGGPPPQSGTFGVGNVPLIFFISCGADCAGVRRGS